MELLEERSKVTDYPDGTFTIAFSVDIPDVQIGPVIPRPKGGVSEKGTATTTATYATVVEYAVTNGKAFQLAKITVACKENTWIKIRWNSADISIEYLVSGAVPFTDWFPWDWKTISGDGAKKIDIQAKYDSAAGDVYAEIVGEEV